MPDTTARDQIINETVADRETCSPMTVLAGPADCLDRDCEEYYTEDGEEPDPGVERCSHIREELACRAHSVESNGGEVEAAPWPCKAGAQR